MATTIIDLDELLGEDKQVRLGGHVFRLPPDLPVELYLRITKFAQTDATDAEMIETLYGELLSLFRHKDPKLEKLPLSVSQVVLAVSRIYGEAAQEETEKLPPQPRRSGGATKSGSRTRASRSR